MPSTFSQVPTTQPSAIDNVVATVVSFTPFDANTGVSVADFALVIIESSIGLPAVTPYTSNALGLIENDTLFATSYIGLSGTNVANVYTFSHPTSILCLSISPCG